MALWRHCRREKACDEAVCDSPARVTFWHTAAGGTETQGTLRFQLWTAEEKEFPLWTGGVVYAGGALSPTSASTERRGRFERKEDRWRIITGTSPSGQVIECGPSV